MILDNLNTTRAAYENMDARLAKALRWLRKSDLKALFAEGDRKIVIDGDRLIAQIQSYDSIKPEAADFEAHRSYIDIQIVVSGREVIEWAPLAFLPEVKKPYDFDKDIVFFKEPAHKVAVPLVKPGDFVVLFPTDGHKPRCQVAGPEKVQKIVVKVSV